jgi:hypothetical protein
MPPCECEIRKIKLKPLENRASGGATAYLRVEKPRFLFLEGSTGAEAVADVATDALPDASAAHADASATRTSTSAARAASSVDRPAAGASAPTPGACSSAASAALGAGGAGSHLSGGARPPSLSSSSSPDDESSKVAGGKVPTARTAGILRPSAPGVPAAGSPAPSYAPPAPVPAAAPRVRSGSRRGRVGPRCVHGHPLLGRMKCQSRGGT